MEQVIDLNQFASGALAERANQAIKKVLENIKDPNTDYKPKRKVTIELTFVSDEAREMTQVSVIAKTKLAPAMPVSSIILIDSDKNGDVLGTEFRKQIPGQQAEGASRYPQSVQARSSHLRKLRGYAQRYERTRHRHRIHLKRHHDRQTGSQRECGRRSACLCMVSKEAQTCQE